MSATTVRLDGETKRELDRLQGMIQAETGARLTHSQLLARLLRVARRHEADILQEGGLAWQPPSAPQLARTLAKAQSVAVRTDASRVDDELYQ